MTDRGTPPDYPEGVATCDNCGWVEHTPEQLAECLDSMAGPVSCIYCGEAATHADRFDHDCCDECDQPDDEPAEFQTMPSGKIIRVRGH